MNMTKLIWNHNITVYNVHVSMKLPMRQDFFTVGIIIMNTIICIFFVFFFL